MSDTPPDQAVLSAPDPIVIRREPASGEAARALIAELDAELIQRYPGHDLHGIAQCGFEEAGWVFFVLTVRGEPAGCGAFRPFQDAAELKRIFVRRPWRGHGLARRILAHLEAEAAAAGYRRAVLETGPLQTEAIGLYRATGWTEIDKFGEYEADPLSLCFEKALAG
jgi:GNAT superfamily N-acetyltransferase